MNKLLINKISSDIFVMKNLCNCYTCCFFPSIMIFLNQFACKNKWMRIYLSYVVVVPSSCGSQWDSKWRDFSTQSGSSGLKRAIETMLENSSIPREVFCTSLSQRDKLREVEGSCMLRNWASGYFFQKSFSTGSILTYNHFYNILRLLDVLTNFPFTTIETMRDYYL